MTERTIKFNEPMLRALLHGSKTQTRRVMKTQLVYGDVCGLFPSWYLPLGESGGTLYPNGKEQIIASCPYGEVGGRLQVLDSGILIEITDVRVDLLNRISEADARAEGVTIEEWHSGGYCAGEALPPALRAFRELWESIKGDGSWDANPWCWVITFRRVTP